MHYRFLALVAYFEYDSAAEPRASGGVAALECRAVHIASFVQRQGTLRQKSIRRSLEGIEQGKLTGLGYLEHRSGAGRATGNGRAIEVPGCVLSQPSRRLNPVTPVKLCNMVTFPDLLIRYTVP